MFGFHTHILYFATYIYFRELKNTHKTQENLETYSQIFVTLVTFIHSIQVRVLCCGVRPGLRERIWCHGRQETLPKVYMSPNQTQESWTVHLLWFATQVVWAHMGIEFCVAWWHLVSVKEIHYLTSFITILFFMLANHHSRYQITSKLSTWWLQMPLNSFLGFVQVCVVTLSILWITHI